MTILLTILMIAAGIALTAAGVVFAVLAAFFGSTGLFDPYRSNHGGVIIGAVIFILGVTLIAFAR